MQIFTLRQIQTSERLNTQISDQGNCFCQPSSSNLLLFPLATLALHSFFSVNMAAMFTDGHRQYRAMKWTIEEL